MEILFMRSAVTASKVNGFGWNLEHREHIVGGWPGQILGTIFEQQDAHDAFHDGSVIMFQPTAAHVYVILTIALALTSREWDARII